MEYDSENPRDERASSIEGPRSMVRQYTVKELAPDERPRERLLLRGAASLSNSDLIAIILNTGTQGETVTTLAQRLLSEHGGLLGLMKLEAVELARIHGLGPAKAAKLKAAMEIAARVVAVGPDQRPQIASPDDVVDLVGIEMAALDQEQLRVVLLDTKHRVLAIRTVYQGSVNQAQVRIAEIFREAIRHNAVALIAVHNHPSGDPTPSGADVTLTADLVKGGDLLDVDVLDHLIVGRGRHASLRRLGLGFPAAR
jgi:DNA repair protein RadC